jgi:hypothetical protein
MGGVSRRTCGFAVISESNGQNKINVVPKGGNR